MTKKTQWIAAGMLAVVAATGCKTPQMAWWKSGDSAESTAVARTAPISPAEAAKQAEQLAANSSQLVGAAATPAQFAASPAASNVNAAPAFNPSAPAAYPKTAAPAYTPAQVAAAAPATPGIYNAGAMPYDPSSPPAGAVAKSQPEVEPASRYNIAGATPTGLDRYPSTGSPSPSVAATPAVESAPAAQAAAPRYPSTDTPPYPSTQAPASQVVGGTGAPATSADRYAAPSQPSESEVRQRTPSLQPTRRRPTYPSTRRGISLSPCRNDVVSRVGRSGNATLIDRNATIGSGYVWCTRHDVARLATGR